jgi:serine protease Do
MHAWPDGTIYLSKKSAHYSIKSHYLIQKGGIIMRKTAFFIIMLLCGAYMAPVHAATQAEEVLKAIVKIRALIPEGARTAAVLGTEREGLGIIFDSKGHILTTGYLIIESESIEVTGPDGQKVKAAFVGYDHATGFGILRTEEPLNVAPIKIGSASDLQEGAPVIVAGHGGLEAAIGARVVARREFTGYWEYILDNAIYTAPAFAQFAGAALIGPEGQLLGVGSLFTQLTIPGLGVLPCNVFIPIDLLDPILDDLISTGRSKQPAKPWLGINAEETHGRVFVSRITAGGPAEEAGLQTDDLILAVNGKPVQGLSDFYRKVWEAGSAGVEVTLGILKGMEIKTISVRTGDRNKFLLMKPKKTI